MYVGLALAGWLLTFLPAVLQRIAPVLASMHSSAGPGKALTVSALTVPAAGKVLNAAHLAALVLLFAALAWQQQPALFRAARAVGAVARWRSCGGSSTPCGHCASAALGRQPAYTV